MTFGGAQVISIQADIGHNRSVCHRYESEPYAKRVCVSALFISMNSKHSFGVIGKDAENKGLPNSILSYIGKTEADNNNPCSCIYYAGEV